MPPWNKLAPRLIKLSLDALESKGFRIRTRAKYIGLNFAKTKRSERTMKISD